MHPRDSFNMAPTYRLSDCSVISSSTCGQRAETSIYDTYGRDWAQHICRDGARSECSFVSEMTVPLKEHRSSMARHSLSQRSEPEDGSDTSTNPPGDSVPGTGNTSPSGPAPSAFAPVAAVSVAVSSDLARMDAPPPPPDLARVKNASRPSDEVETFPSGASARSPVGSLPRADSETSCAATAGADSMSSLPGWNGPTNPRITTPLRSALCALAASSSDPKLHAPSHREDLPVVAAEPVKDASQAQRACSASKRVFIPRYDVMPDEVGRDRAMRQAYCDHDRAREAAESGKTPLASSPLVSVPPNTPQKPVEVHVGGGANVRDGHRSGQNSCYKQRTARSLTSRMESPAQFAELPQTARMTAADINCDVGIKGACSELPQGGFCERMSSGTPRIVCDREPRYFRSVSVSGRFVTSAKELEPQPTIVHCSTSRRCEPEPQCPSETQRSASVTERVVHTRKGSPSSPIRVLNGDLEVRHDKDGVTVGFKDDYFDRLPSSRGPVNAAKGSSSGLASPRRMRSGSLEACATPRGTMIGFAEDRHRSSSRGRGNLEACATPRGAMIGFTEDRHRASSRGRSRSASGAHAPNSSHSDFPLVQGVSVAAGRPPREMSATRQPNSWVPPPSARNFSSGCLPRPASHSWVPPAATVVNTPTQGQGSGSWVPPPSSPLCNLEDYMRTKTILRFEETPGKGSGSFVPSTPLSKLEPLLHSASQSRVLPQATVVRGAVSSSHGSLRSEGGCSKGSLGSPPRRPVGNRSTLPARFDKENVDSQNSQPRCEADPVKVMKAWSKQFWDGVRKEFE